MTLVGHSMGSFVARCVARLHPERIRRLVLIGTAVTADTEVVREVIAPGATGTYFAWPLGPPALAALVGGFYLASAVVFGYAGTLTWPRTRGLWVAVLAFTLPTLAATALHRDTFDFARPAAVAWVVLFVASPVTFTAMLVAGRGVRATARPRLGPVPRLVLAVSATALAVLAAVLWTAAVAPVPFALAPLGARFLAAWTAFLAVLAFWPAFRPERDEARLPLIALVVFPLGALLAATAHPGALTGTGWRATWLRSSRCRYRPVSG